MPRANAAAVSALASEEQAQYLTFTVGGELLGLGILSVKEIIEFQSLTTVPMMPAAIRGVINLRGAVVPVMDLAVRLGKSPAEVGKRTCIVIIELHLDVESQIIGALVDAVNQVLEIPAAEIEPAPSFGTKIRRDFMRGIGKVDDKLVVLLDAIHVLTLEEPVDLPESSGCRT